MIKISALTDRSFSESRCVRVDVGEGWVVPGNHCYKPVRFLDERGA